MPWTSCAGKRYEPPTAFMDDDAVSHTSQLGHDGDDASSIARSCVSIGQEMKRLAYTPLAVKEKMRPSSTILRRPKASDGQMEATTWWDGGGCPRRVTSSQSFEMLKEMKREIKAGAYEGGGWSGRPMSRRIDRQARPQSATTYNRHAISNPRPATALCGGTECGQKLRLQGRGTTACTESLPRAKPFRPFRPPGAVYGNTTGVDDRFLMRQDLPPRPTLARFAEEGILDELRSRSKAALTKAYTAATAQKPHSLSSKDRIASALSQRRPVTGPRLDAQATNVLSKEIDLLSALMVRLKSKPKHRCDRISHGKASGSRA